MKKNHFFSGFFRPLRAPSPCVQGLGARAGFTLVEIIVATVVLALVASGIFSVMISSRYLVSRSKKRFSGTEIARSVIEEMKPLIRADQWWSTNTSYPLYPNGTWTNWTVAAADGNYSVRYKIDNITGVDYRKITVQVKWNETNI